MIRSADVRSDAEARQWETRLNRDWPQRSQVAAWIVSRIDCPPASSPRVVELACGAGYLAAALFHRFPAAHFCGFDLSTHLLEFARRRLTGKESDSPTDRVVELRSADLAGPNWEETLHELGWAGQVDAVISLQALHDLGGQTQQVDVLERSRALLRTGGQLIYGDLLVNADNPHTSRFTEGQHEEMLRAAGFPEIQDRRGADGAATARFGDFGCFCRRR